MNGKLIYTKGLPGSGKSTWAREFLATQAPGEIVRVNKDDLRAMMHDARYDGDNTEKAILAARDAIIELALSSGKTVVVDDTNFAPVHQRRFEEIAKKYRADVVEKDFTQVPLHVCIDRDAKRPNSIGSKPILLMHSRYLKGTRVEVTKLVQDKALPRAIIVDLDGTVALANGRGYVGREQAKAVDDLPNQPIVDLVRRYWKDGYQVIFMSGREREYAPETVTWIERTFQGIKLSQSPFLLYMRRTGDFRADDVVKKELFDEYVKDSFYIEFVLDDRNQVVRLWREMGLTTLQVADGDF